MDPENPLHVKPTPVGEEVAELVKQEVLQNEELEGTEIASIDSSFWDSFLKLIEVVSTDLEPTDVVSINKGKLLIAKGSGAIYGDLTDIFGNHTWNIKDPNNTLKKLKLISGGEKVTIMDAAKSNLVYSSVKGVVKSNINIVKTDIDNIQTVERIDPGELKHTFKINKNEVSRMSNAKKVLGAPSFNIIIDVNTFEVLSININSEISYKFIDAAGRETMRYKAITLFPVPKVDTDLVFEVYSKDKDIYIKTISNITVTVLTYQVRAIKNPDIQLDFNDY